jgi:hypothetical protein
MPRIIFLLVSLTFLSACHRVKHQIVSEHRPISYFDSLINSQVRYLLVEQASVDKIALVGRNKDQIRFTPDSASWEQEFNIFRGLSNYERGVSQNIYRREDGLDDQFSNLKVRRFTTENKVPVRELKFFYHKEFRHIKRIEARYRQANELYATERKLIMEFEEVGNYPILSEYQIEGAQKLIMGDTTLVSIHAKVLFNNIE